MRERQYISVSIPEQRFWLAEVGLGLGIWTGIYEHIQGQWLRWYNAAGTWISTPAEQAHKQVQRERWRTQEERRRADVAEQELSKLRAELTTAS